MNWKYALGLALIFALIVALSVFNPDWPSPAKWLQDWTTWVGAVVTIVVAARVFWVGADYLVALKKRKLESRQG